VKTLDCGGQVTPEEQVQQSDDDMESLDGNEALSALGPLAERNSLPTLSGILGSKENPPQKQPRLPSP
jgi:hypothetical protein